MLGIVVPLLMSGIVSTAQPWPMLYEHYSVNDGLSDRLVKAIVQTKEGLLWLGTTNGLNRFDGYGFLVFDNHPDSELKISDGNIYRLYLDKNGCIVIVYQANSLLFDILDPETLQVQQVKALPDFGINGQPRLITVNSQGDILVAAIGEHHVHIYRYLRDNRFEKLASVPGQYAKKSVKLHLLQLGRNRFMLNDSEKGLRIYDGETDSVQDFARSDFAGMSERAPYPGTANVLHQDRSGRVWLALEGYQGIFCLQPGSPGFQRASELPQQSYYTAIWEDELGNVLLSSTAQARNPYPLDGLHGLRPDGSAMDFSRFLELSRYIVNVFSKDFSQTVFLGIDTGLKIVQSQQSRVVKYLAKNLGHDLRGAVMRGIASDGQRFVYFAREVGPWYELDLQTGFLDTLALIDPHSRRVAEMSCACNLQMDGQGNLWGVSCLGTVGQTGRLHRYNTKTCELTTYEFEHRFTAFTLGRDGLIWLCAEPSDARGMLVAFDPKAQTFTPFNDREGQNPLRSAIPRFVLEASNGLLWIGTENGLYQIDRQERGIKTYQAAKGRNSLSSNVIYVIHEDPRGRLWLGTTHGLDILDPEYGLFEHYGRTDGLASNTVCGILPDQDGNYWISTYNGLSYFEYDDRRFRNFYTADGLSHDEFNRFSYLRGPDGRFYFGGVNGINVFHREDLLVHAQAPPLVLTMITRYNARQNKTIVQHSELANLKELTILANDSYFTIYFSLPKYKNTRRNRYQTLLEGYDKEWSISSTTPNLRLNKPPPGKYTLRVRATDVNGNQAASELAIPIVVKPHFYQTLWFKMLMILFVGGLGYAYSRYHLRHRLEVERVRTKLSSDLHDEVSGLLAGIAVQAELVQAAVPDQASRDRLKHISEVSRRAMSKMSDVIWSIDSRKDRVGDLLQRMQEHTDEVLRPLDIPLEMHVEKMDRQHKMPVTIRQNLYFIFKEAINNIAKHSNASRAAVKFYNEGQEFFLLIQDNGKAAQQIANRKNGQGLDNMRLRAQRIGAKLDILPHDNGFQICVRGKRFC